MLDIAEDVSAKKTDTEGTIMKKINSLLLVLVMSTTLALGAFASSYFPRCGGTQSLVDGLKEVGARSDYDYREQIWIANCGTSKEYFGTSEQNKLLLSMLREGTLRRPEGGSEPAPETKTPTVVSNKESDNLMEVVSGSAALREKPKGSSNAYITLRAGDIVNVVGKKQNRAGNLWYEVNYAGVNMWCYSDNLAPHRHSFSRAADGVEYCACGQLQVDGGVRPMADVAAAESLLGTDLQALGVAVTGIGASLEAAGAAILPGALVVVAAVAGTYFLVKLGEHLTTIESVQELSVASTRDLYEDLDEDLYFAAFALRKGCMLAFNPNGMDLEEANSYLIAACKAAACIDPANSLLNAVMYKEKTFILNGIYTNNKENAKRLAQRFEENGEGYTYGSSVTTNKKSWYYRKGYSYAGNHLSEVNTDQCFEHFHLFTFFDNGRVANALSKAKNVHIMWGLPVCSPYYFNIA